MCVCVCVCLFVCVSRGGGGGESDRCALCDPTDMSNFHGPQRCQSYHTAYQYIPILLPWPKKVETTVRPGYRRVLARACMHL